MAEDSVTAYSAFFIIIFLFFTFLGNRTPILFRPLSFLPESWSPMESSTRGRGLTGPGALSPFLLVTAFAMSTNNSGRWCARRGFKFPGGLGETYFQASQKAFRKDFSFFFGYCPAQLWGLGPDAVSSCHQPEDETHKKNPQGSRTRATGQSKSWSHLDFP